MNNVYAPRALRDLESIGTYLIECSPSSAVNVLAAIKSTIDTLRFFPQIGRRVDAGTPATVGATLSLYRLSIASPKMSF
jgi:plasmid stabilization system protein ParE